MKLTLHVFGVPIPFVAEPQSVVLEEAEGMHDLATLSFGNTYGRTIVSQLDLGNVAPNDLGPPAAIEIVSQGELTTFYGYIDTTVEHRTRGETKVEIYFLSASSIMRNGKPRVWRNKLPFEIASDLVAPYGLGLEMDKIPYPMTSFAQSDESDWETLRNLAVHNGLSLTVAGTIIQMRDVIRATRRAKGSTKTPRFRRPGSPPSVRGLEATQFTQVASRTPLGGERHRYYGIDPLGVAFEVTAGVTVIERSPGVRVDTLGAALREARRHEAMGRFVTRASFNGVGYLACNAGECIIVDNDKLPEYWYISSSKHTLTTVGEDHSMELDLCRQDGDVPGSITTTVPRRPEPVLIGKEWRADRQWRVQL